MATPNSRKRPFGVLIIVVLQLFTMVLLLSTLTFVGSWLPILNFQFIQLTSFVSQAVSNVVIKTAVDILVLSYMVVVTIGFWRLKRWAWLLLMIQLGVGLFSNLWQYFNGTSNYFVMAIQVLIVLYLNQRDVQQAFGHIRKTARLP